MIRVVLEYSPTQYAIGPFDGTVEDAPLMLKVPGYVETFYRNRSTTLAVYYRRAVSGWGDASKDPTHRGPVFDTRQQ